MELKRHNELRAKHSAGAMTIDPELAKGAQAWADHLQATNSFAHSHSGGKYGENLYAAWGQSGSNSPKSVNAWYSEIKKYNFGHPGFTHGTGHFT